jgi:hypothetical protein
MKSSTILFAAFVFLSSCKSTPAGKEATNDPFLSGLQKQPISNSGFEISLPTDYKIRQKQGADFTVYYFAPADSTLKAAFTGGMYLGNFPSEFGAESEGCKTSTIKGMLLGKEREWKLFSCDSSFFAQTIVDNKDESAAKVHVFGRGTSADNLNRMIRIFSTLRK